MATLSSYDWLLARRTVSLGIALGVLVFFVMVGTDEGLATTGGRLGRLAALVSLAAGSAAFIATEQARSRGELRALGAMGIAPVRASGGALVGGTVVGAVGPVLAMLRGVDLSGLFPRAVPFGGSWVGQGGSWLDTTRGLVVHASGEMELVRATGFTSLAPDVVPRTATVLALVVAAIAFPLWATARGTWLRRSSVALGLALASVAVFHLVAAARVPAFVLLLPPSLLLLDACLLHRGVSWS